MTCYPRSQERESRTKGAPVAKGSLATASYVLLPLFKLRFCVKVAVQSYNDFLLGAAIAPTKWRYHYSDWKLHLSSSSVELDSSPIKSSVEQIARKRMDDLQPYLGRENRIDEGHRKRKIAVSVCSCSSDFRTDMSFPLSTFQRCVSIHRCKVSMNWSLLTPTSGVQP